jgi:hypothetical protein
LNGKVCVRIKIRQLLLVEYFKLWLFLRNYNNFSVVVVYSLLRPIVNSLVISHKFSVCFRVCGNDDDEQVDDRMQIRATVEN